MRRDALLSLYGPYVWLGAYLALPCLFAVWAALAKQHLAVRLAQVMGLATLMGLAATWAHGRNRPQQEIHLDFLLLLLSAIAVQALALALLGWRYDWRLELQRHDTSESGMRLNIGQALLWTATAVGLLGLTSWVVADWRAVSENLRSTGWLAGTIGVLLLSLVSLPLLILSVRLVLGDGRRKRVGVWLKRTVVLLLLLACVPIFAVSMDSSFRGTFFERVSESLLPSLAPVAFLAGYLVALLGSLVVVRFCGFRLGISLRLTTTASVSQPEQVAVANSDSSSAVPKPKRRWFQFSLATLFLVTTAVALWLGVWTDRARKQQRAVEALLKRGGRVTYSYKMKRGPGKPTPPGPAWLREALGIDYLDHVLVVVLTGDTFTDADLEHLQGLPGLENLTLDSANITDAGLAHLEGLRRLDGLHLAGDRITDAGLAHLEGLHRLQSLDLRSERITDAGLVHLQGLRELQVLWLQCSITDAGMDHLTPLVKLRRLRSRGSPDDPVKREVVDALDRPTILDFVDFPLVDVCDYLQDYHGIKLQIDDAALKDAKIVRNVKVTYNTKGKGLSLHVALHSMFEPLGLGWHVGQGSLVITTREVAAIRHAGVIRLQQALPNIEEVKVDW